MMKIQSAHTIIDDTKPNILAAKTLITSKATTTNIITTENPPTIFKAVDPDVTINPAIKVPKLINKNPTKKKYLKYSPSSTAK